MRQEAEGEWRVSFFRVPLIVPGSVHLGLQLVGASADGPPVATSPLGAGVLLEVLPERRGEDEEDEEGAAGGRDRTRDHKQSENDSH